MIAVMSESAPSIRPSLAFSVGVGPGCRGDAGRWIRVRAARVHGRLPRGARLPVHRLGRRPLREQLRVRRAEERAVGVAEVVELRISQHAAQQIHIRRPLDSSPRCARTWPTASRGAAARSPARSTTRWPTSARCWTPTDRSPRRARGGPRAPGTASRTSRRGTCRRSSPVHRLGRRRDGRPRHAAGGRRRDAAEGKRRADAGWYVPSVRL
jgi:type II secretory pathway pseudopilin PulG